MSEQKKVKYSIQRLLTVGPNDFSICHNPHGLPVAIAAGKYGKDREACEEMIQLANAHPDLLARIEELEGRGAWYCASQPPDADVRVLLYSSYQCHPNDEVRWTFDVGYWTNFNGGGWVRSLLATPEFWRPFPDPPAIATDAARATLSKEGGVK